MDFEMINLDDREVVGVVTRIEPTSADYPRIWADGFDRHQPEVAALAAEPEYYGVYYDCGQEGAVDFLAGMIVAASSPASGELDRRVLPGGLYARFTCTLATIGVTWAAIYGEWLPSSGLQLDSSRPAFEIFPPDAGGPNSPVSISVAVLENGG